MNVVNNSGVIHAPNSQVESDYDNKPNSAGSTGSQPLKGDNVFSGGLSTLYIFMQMLSEQADVKYSAINAHTKMASVARIAIRYLDEVINRFRQEIPSAYEDIYETAVNIPAILFLKDNNFLDYLDIGNISREHLASLPSDDWYMVEVRKIKETKLMFEDIVETVPDFVSSSQLQLQKLMQTYNVSVSLINSLQTMLSDMNKTIAQGIH